MNVRKTMARAAGIGAVATAALGLFSTGAANADTFIPLPGGSITETMDDGTVVTISMTGESANINPSMGATPLHRNAWVSGSAQVQLSGTNGNVGGKIVPGYVVGCQVNISGGGANGGPSAGANYDGTSPSAGANVGGNLTLGPGQSQAFYVLDQEAPDDFGSEAHYKRNKFSGNSGSVTWSDETINLNGCGGYAQARSFIAVQVETDHVITAYTLWGQPFSLG
ncbi:MspA family porin [Nocardia tengchongensis]|uniref:MspA family porin n=2 Tax=Nocardia tengchongensis TaxID=2055889 RepID=A0ABX8CWK4_9NOCA|nr:MspA family porin [Nocardia tengchongensis]QVI23274.1 MspA family porin [Nocardia tengchongensis]